MILFNAIKVSPDEARSMQAITGAASAKDALLALVTMAGKGQIARTRTPEEIAKLRNDAQERLEKSVMNWKPTRAEEDEILARAKRMREQDKNERTSKKESRPAVVAKSAVKARPKARAAGR